MEPKDLTGPERAESNENSKKKNAKKTADTQEQVKKQEKIESDTQGKEPEAKGLQEEKESPVDVKSDKKGKSGKKKATKTGDVKDDPEVESDSSSETEAVVGEQNDQPEIKEEEKKETQSEEKPEPRAEEKVVSETGEKAGSQPEKDSAGKMEEQVEEETTDDQKKEKTASEADIKAESQPEEKSEASQETQSEEKPEPRSEEKVVSETGEKADSQPEEKSDKQESQTETSGKGFEQVDLKGQSEQTAAVSSQKKSGKAEQESVIPSTKEKEEKVADHKGKQSKQGAKKEKPDYTAFSPIELVNAFRKVLDNNGDHDIKDEVEAIKSAFYKKLKEEIEEQKKEFLEDGGDEEDFVAEENPYEQDIKDLLKRYRQLRHEFNKKLDQEKEVNLQEKYEIVEEIKGLIHKEESINKTFQEFRELQQRWREVGLVPQSKMKDLWETYHFHVENFYDYIKINKELRDLDLKKNLEMKIRLCEQAEELLLEPNIVKAFNQLQKLHDRWREIGPVPRENKDDLWERFKASTAKINKKHQEYFEIRKAEQKENLEAKRALCEQVEEINQLELLTHKEWAEKSKEVINLQKVWRTIGFAPRKDNNKIYKRFREACDSFFDAKREFYAKNKELQLNNLELKTDLCMQAEALKESTDWNKTKQDLINIQKQWKEIGPVPRKNSDALWKRFRAACDYFFERKSEHFSNIDSEQEDNLKQKEQIIQNVLDFEPEDDADKNLNALKDFQRRWTEIGHVPFKKKDEIQKKYREAINKLFDDLNLDESKRNMLKFKTKIATFSESSHGQNKMRLERDKYMVRMKQLESDLVLLDNNIGFFAKSKNAETLIRDVKRKIEQTREKIELLKNKIRVIDEMDHLDE